MKKYFMKGTEEELTFGDMIEVDFTRDTDDGKVTHHHLECKFLPEMVDLLLDSDIIEVREVGKPNENLVDFEDDEEEVDAELIFEEFDKLNCKLDALADCINKLNAALIAREVDRVKPPKKSCKNK